MNDDIIMNSVENPIDNIIVVGAGVSGIMAVTELIKGGYPADNILIIDKGKDPFKRKTKEVMHGFLGAGAWSDGKIVYKHNQIGGHLSKYCGEDKADELVAKVMDYIREFHPKPDEIMFSDPHIDPSFIKPHFDLRKAPTWHIGTNYLHIMAKNWYTWLIGSGVKFMWETEVESINFENKNLYCENSESNYTWYFDRLIYNTGKSGIDFTQRLMDENKIMTETKPAQIGVRFEAPQKYFQELIDISYDFKLYQKFEEEGVSIRTFCTNNNAAYVAEEETYGMKSYNGHSYKEESKINNMTNFGIIMEIKNINRPFEWAIDVVKKAQKGDKGVYYSPFSQRSPSISGLEVIEAPEEMVEYMNNAYGEYSNFIWKFITDLNKVFKFGNNYGLYVPEVKFLSDEVLVNYYDLSLKQFPHIHFSGDSLSARGIAVSGAQGIYVAESILRKYK